MKQLTFKTWEDFDKFLNALSKRQPELHTKSVAKVFEDAKQDTKDKMELKDKN